MIREIPAIIVLVLVCILISLLLIGMSFEKAKTGIRNITQSPPMIEVIGEPEIDIRGEKPANMNAYKYRIDIRGLEIKYTGPDNIDMIEFRPLLYFKGKEEWEDTHTLTQSNGFHDVFDFHFELSSKKKLMEKKGSAYHGSMCEGDSFLFTSNEGGNFIISLDSLREIPRIGFAKPCLATFRVECEDFTIGLFLIDKKFCIEDELDKTRCEGHIKVCNGNVDIWLGPGGDIKTFCDKHMTEDVEIEVEGGKRYDAGENLFLMFWKASTCVNDVCKNCDRTELLKHCSDDLIGMINLIEHADEITPISGSLCT